MAEGTERLLWSIGAPDGRAEELVDNYKDPLMLGEVTYHVSGARASQKWPLFHPSEADPEAGYRLHPYSILFNLEDVPQGAYALRIQYLVIAPRLAYIELRVNGLAGEVHLRPTPSHSGEIRLLSGLHTTIYSEGMAEVVLPAALLRQGENRLELVARDGGEYLRVERIEAIKRLDRMANGAGFLYQQITFSRLGAPPAGVKAEVEPTVLYRRNAEGELVESCHLYLELQGGVLAAGPLTLTLQEGARVAEVSFDLPATAFGHVKLAFDLFDGEGEVAWRLGAPGFQGEGSLYRRRKWKVFVTPHSHTDIGYTHRQWEVGERLCRNIDYALEMLAQEPEAFAYHLDSAWALELFLQSRSRAQREKLFAAVRAGKIGVAGNYVDLLTQTAALEDLIRNQSITEAMLRPAGLSTTFDAVVDVASITGSMPALLEGAGIKYLLHANNQDRGPFRLNGGLHRISPFWWEGTNGGQVLVWLAKMYCELRKVCGSPPTLDSAGRGLELWLQEYEHAAYAPDAVLLYGQEADNTDLDPQPVSFVKRWNESYAYPQLIPCAVSQFFSYVEERFGESLQRVKGDSGAYWEDGVGSSIVPTMQVREAQAALPAAERLESLAVIHTPEWAFPAAQFDAAWQQLLLYDEHTWGAFNSAREPESLLVTDQWAVKESFARNSKQWAERLLHVAAVRHSLNWSNEGREVVVYNPQSWSVTGTVRVEIEPDEVAVLAETGERIPMRRLKSLPSQQLVELWVEGLPGLSYRRFVLERLAEPAAVAITAEAPAAGRVLLENDHYRLVVDLDRGAVASWFDKALERELTDGADAWGLGQLLYAQGGEGSRLVSNQADLPDGSPTVLGEFRLIDAHLSRFEYGLTLTARGEVPCGELTLSWSLPDRMKEVELQFTLLKRESLAKEAVYVAFPLALPGASVRSDSQLGWVEWATQQLPGACKEWLPLQTSILVADGEAAVQICSPDIPLFTVGEVVRGRWPKELDLTGGRLFSYVLNNYWHTNYKASQGGEIRFGYRLTSGREIPLDAAYRRGWESRRVLYGHRISFQEFRPVRAPYASPTGGVLAKVGTESVVLSTIMKARWAPGLILRLQEIAGRDQTAPVAFPGRRITRAWLTDLLERELRELPVSADGSLQVPVPAWSLATIRFEVE